MPHGPDCPDENRLRMLAVGLAESSEAAKLLEHMAACDYCGRVLKEAVEDLVLPISEEEQQFAASLPLAQPRARRALARQLAGRRPPFPHRIRQLTLKFVPLGAGAAVVCYFLAPGFAAGQPPGDSWLKPIAGSVLPSAGWRVHAMASLESNAARRPCSGFGAAATGKACRYRDGLAGQLKVCGPGSGIFRSTACTPFQEK